MKLTIAISPCPNDTYIFDSIYNKQLCINDIAFEFVLLDIEELNKQANTQKYDIIKVSYAHSFTLLDKYVRLRAGGAMGFGVGPLFVKKKGNISDEKGMRIAIPGKNTTANFLLSYLYPNYKSKFHFVFNEIENAILENKVDAGVLIHEGRFTYEEKGLSLIADLGKKWEEKTALPIPLGCIMIRKEIDFGLQQQINELIANSIRLSNSKYPELSSFIKNNAKEMNEDIMRRHIELYVNEYSIDIGTKGQEAIRKMRESLL